MRNYLTETQLKHVENVDKILEGYFSKVETIEVCSEISENHIRFGMTKDKIVSGCLIDKLSIYCEENNLDYYVTFEHGRITIVIH